MRTRHPNCALAVLISLMGTLAQADIVYITSNTNNAVYRYNINATGTPTLLSTISDPSFDRPYGLSQRLNGDLLVGSRSSSSDGGTLTSIRANGCADVSTDAFTTPPDILNHPFGLAVLCDQAYMIDGLNAGRILRFAFDSSGAPVLPVTHTEGVPFSNGRNLVVHSGLRELLYSGVGTSNRIYRFRINDDASLTPNGTITGNGINNPHGLAVAADGELFFVNSVGNSVSRFRFDAAGQPIANGTVTGNGMNDSVGIAFSPWGEMFVVNQGSTAVSRFVFNTQGQASPNGTFELPTPGNGIVFATMPPAMLIGPETRSCCLGGEATFSVIAPGTAADGFSYQWRFNGALIDPSANPSTATETLVLGNVSTSSEGAYTCVVSNACGSRPSNVATLRVATLTGDFDTDGDVDLSDLTLLLSHFGATCP